MARRRPQHGGAMLPRTKFNPNKPNRWSALSKDIRTMPDGSQVDYSRNPPMVIKGPRGGAAPPRQLQSMTTLQQPFDALKEDTISQANQGLTDTLANIDYQQNQTRNEYGLDPTVAANPLSRASLLERTYQQSRAGNTNSFAARGRLYSGALQNAMNQTNFTNLQQKDSLQREYDRLMQNFVQQRAGAKSAFEAQQLAARGDALDRAVNQGPDESYDSGPQASASQATNQQIHAAVGKLSKSQRAAYFRRSTRSSRDRYLRSLGLL